MAAYVHEDPINIKFILDYIKTKYGDSTYNTVLDFRGSTDNPRFGVDMNLRQLIEYANQHNGNIPTNFNASLIIEYNNGEMTGNFIINILQVYTSATNVDTSKCRPYTTTYHSRSSTKIYFSACSCKRSDNTWNYSGPGIYKLASIGCSGTSSTKTIQYVRPNNGGINGNTALQKVDFTNSTLTNQQECIPNYYSYNNENGNVKAWYTAPAYISRVATSDSNYPLIIDEKGLSYWGTYDLTDAEKQRYIDYDAPLIMMEETQPFDGINCFDLKFTGTTYIAEKHQYEEGIFIRLDDAVSTHSKVVFTNETTGTTYDDVSYAKPLLVPDEVFEKPGLIRADVYGTGASASTVQKQFYFKVKENPSTRTVLSGLTMGTNIKPIRIKHNNRIEFLWSHTGNSNPAIEILDDDMMVKYMDVWNDSNPNVKYQISPSSGKFAIPLSYFDLNGTFHGLVRCGNNKIDSVVTELIWNFE